MICSCCAGADEMDGFVYLAGAETAHPDPDTWRGHLLNFPLHEEGRRWMCTQGFGGAGHHKGCAMHHAVDFECDVGTPVCSVAAGTVILADTSKRVGAGHVDLLPEANIIEVEHEDGSIAVYLHLAHGSACVQPGDKVQAGSQLALTGNTGFTTVIGFRGPPPLPAEPPWTAT